MTQEMPDRLGISGLEVLVQTIISAWLSEDIKAELLPVTQAGNGVTGTLQARSWGQWKNSYSLSIASCLNLHVTTKTLKISTTQLKKNDHYSSV